MLSWRGWESQRVRPGQHAPWKPHVAAGACITAGPLPLVSATSCRLRGPDRTMGEGRRHGTKSARIERRHLVDVRPYLIWRVVHFFWRVWPADCIVPVTTIVPMSETTIGMSITLGPLIGVIPQAIGRGLMDSSGSRMLFALAALSMVQLLQLGTAPIQQVAVQDLARSVAVDASEQPFDCPVLNRLRRLVGESLAGGLARNA